MAALGERLFLWDLMDCKYFKPKESLFQTFPASASFRPRYWRNRAMFGTLAKRGLESNCVAGAGGVCMGARAVLTERSFDPGANFDYWI